ncbi:tetratricopeptide repeat protein [Dyella solisilvae]|uniref:Tetratricopeptide repeat protein n=1 Tax=Dyella solisilvae TaxID=1920168 RepID=A0A370K4Q9_9GAMM|nr:tetratricopeptide repeat protein [Dyella solisilvae]RDI97641.1 tetratricopeptide repeat protein [Dyella solisilvae]
MSRRSRHLIAAPAALAVALLAACSQPVAPSQATRPSVSDEQMLSSIHAAGDKEKSVIDVNPLRDPGVAALQDAADGDLRTGQYQAAAVKLDQALKISPNSPDLLQDRAELAIRLRDYASAEQFAHRSWELGPKLGPLCARNWQTIAELRQRAGDEAGASNAIKSVTQCHVEGIQRY